MVTQIFWFWSLFLVYPAAIPNVAPPPSGLTRMIKIIFCCHQLVSLNLSCEKRQQIWANIIWQTIIIWLLCACWTDKYNGWWVAAWFAQRRQFFKRHAKFGIRSIVNDIPGKSFHKVNHLEASQGLFGNLKLQQPLAISHSHPNNCSINYFTVKILCLPSLCSNSFNDGSDPCTNS